MLEGGDLGQWEEEGGREGKVGSAPGVPSDPDRALSASVSPHPPNRTAGSCFAKGQ